MLYIALLTHLKQLISTILPSQKNIEEVNQI